MRYSFQAVLIISLSVLLPLALFGQDNYRIKSIGFHGNYTFSNASILENMSIKEVSVFEKYIEKEEPSLFNEELLEAELKRIENFYQTHGFVDALISYSISEIDHEKQQLTIDFYIEENSPYQFGVIGISFPEKDSTSLTPDQKQMLEKTISIKQGDRFEDILVKNQLSLIKQYLYSKGYVHANCEYDIKLNTEQRVATVNFKVSSGQICYFGKTELNNQSHVSDSFIYKQLQYSQGKRFNNTLLEESRQRLFDTAVFTMVSFTFKEQGKNDTIPILLRLEPSGRRSSKLGAGYGTEDKFRIFGEINYKGFPGEITKLKLEAKHSAIEPYSAGMYLSQPQFFHETLTGNFHAFVSRNAEPGYNVRSIGVNIPIGLQWKEKNHLTFAYYFQNVRQFLEVNDPDFNNPESEEFLYNKSGIMLHGHIDRSSPEFSPEEGYKITAGIKTNGYFFGGDFDYTTFWAKVHLYQSLGSTTFAFKLFGGTVVSSTDDFIPVEDRFYAGGSQSVRAWSRSALGPKRESGSPLGGKSYFESGIELRQALFWRVSGVLFFEGGNVWRDSFKIIPQEIAYAVGGGLRVRTPIGPIRLDVGVPVWNEKKTAHFSLSVGQAF